MNQYDRDLTSIYWLQLSNPIYSCLRHVHGINTVRGLIKYTGFELLQKKGISKLRLKVIEKTLEQFDFYLREEKIKISRQGICLEFRHKYIILINVTKTQFVTSYGRYNRNTGNEIGENSMSYYIMDDELKRINNLYKGIK